MLIPPMEPVPVVPTEMSWSRNQGWRRLEIRVRFRFRSRNHLTLRLYVSDSSKFMLLNFSFISSFMRCLRLLIKFPFSVEEDPEGRDRHEWHSVRCGIESQGRSLPAYPPLYPSDRLRNLMLGLVNFLQGDHSGSSKPPVDFNFITRHVEGIL